MEDLAVNLASQSLPGDHISAELERLLDSRRFRASSRLRLLLSTLVKHSLQGKQQQLTQRWLATHVFERGEQFDPEQDAIVRVEISKLRSALNRYYEDIGDHDGIRISIPRGRYAPSYDFPENRTTAAQVTLIPDTDHIRLDSPRLVIRPFMPMNDATGDQAIARVLSEDIQIVLAQTPYLRVSTDYHPGTAQQTDCCYRLHGSVNRIGERISISTRLLNNANDELVWTDRFDAPGDAYQNPGVHDNIVTTIACRIADTYSGIINRKNIARLPKHPQDSVTSYEATLYFYRYLALHSDDSYRAARRALDISLKQEPDHSLLIAMYADMLRAGHSLGYTDEPDPIATVLLMAQRAVNLSPDSATCRLALCYAQLQARDHNGLLQTARPLLDSRLVLPSYRADAAMALALSGEWKLGCEAIQEALGKLVDPTHAFTYALFLNAYRTGDFERAWHIAGDFRDTSIFWRPLLQTAVLGQLGRSNDAKPFIGQLLQLRPQFETRARRWISCFVAEDALVDKLLEGVRKAGLNPA